MASQKTPRENRKRRGYNWFFDKQWDFISDFTFIMFVYLWYYSVSSKELTRVHTHKHKSFIFWLWLSNEGFGGAAFGFNSNATLCWNYLTIGGVDTWSWILCYIFDSHENHASLCNDEWSWGHLWQMLYCCFFLRVCVWSLKLLINFNLQ